MQDITPKYFPGEKVKKTMGNSEVMVAKIGIWYGWQIDYMCWDWSSYDWLDDFQIYSDTPRVIWFNITNDGTRSSNKNTKSKST